MISIKLRCIRELNRVYVFLLKFFHYIQGRDAARVYMFHSVVNEKENIYSKFAISTSTFKRFIEYELSRGQLPMNLEDLKNAVDTPSAFDNHFAVSFDDIYDSVFSNAFPILKQLNIPFVIFVSPNLVNTVDPSSRNPMITMEHLKELMNNDLCIVGSHGMEHKPFRTYSDDVLSQSIKDSKKILDKEVEIFAFPFGRRIEVSTSNMSSVKEAGYFCSFSAIDGSLKQKWFSGRWFLPRILVSEDYAKRKLR